MHLLNQPALGADPLQVTDHEHANHEFGIDRGPPDAAVVPGHALAHEAEIQQPVDLPQRVVGWDMILEAKDVEQRLRRSLPSHHRAASPQQPGTSESRHSHSFNRRVFHRNQTILVAQRFHQVDQPMSVLACCNQGH
jgi:hypothetical protein